MRRWVVLLVCLATAAQVLSCLKAKTWKLYVRVGRGRVEGYPDGTMLAYFLAIRDPEGAAPYTGTAALVSWEGITNAVHITQGSAPLYAGWLYHTDLRVFPAAEILTEFEPPDGDPVEDRRQYTASEATLDYPALSADTAGGAVIVSIGPVAGAVSYLMRVTEDDDAFSTSSWKTTNRGAAFTDTIPAGTLQSGRAYHLWGVVANIDIPTIRVNPGQIPALPAYFAHSEGQGPSFTAP